MIDRREFLVSGAALATPAVILGGGTARKDWFRRQARVFLLDFQVPDPVDQGVPGMPHFFQKLDSAAIVERVAASGANVLLVHAKCNQGNAYYNTKVGHKHSDLGERDLMTEFSSHCRKRGIGILYYVQLSRDRRSFKEHPDRQAVSAQGPVLMTSDNPLLAGTEERQVVCMNGPHRQFIKDILAELARGYDFDGFWLDCYNWWGKVNPCFCDLLESHIPVSVISERDAAAGRWRGARALILDAAECVPGDCARALEEFVDQGGGLIVTNRTSLRDGGGKLLENFGLSKLAGADFLGMTEKWYGFINPEKRHPITAGLTLEFPMSVYETLQARVRAHAGAEALATIINPMPGFHMGYPPNERTGAPALLFSNRGKGRVVYAAAPLGAIYSRSNHPDNQRLIANAAQWAAGSPPPIRAKAPGTVEMTAWRDEKARRTVIHLVNRTGAGLPQGEGEFMHEVIPVFGIEVHLDGRHAGRAAKSQPSGRVLPVRRDGTGMTVTLERLDIWEVLEIA